MLDLDEENPDWTTVASPNKEHFEYECERPATFVLTTFLYLVKKVVKTVEVLILFLELYRTGEDDHVKNSFIPKLY